MKIARGNNENGSIFIESGGRVTMKNSNEQNDKLAK